MRQLEFLRQRLSQQAFRTVCETVRGDMGDIARDIEVSWTDSRFEQARERLHELKGIFGDVGHEPGMTWCDRIRNEPAPPLPELIAALRVELDHASRMLDAMADT